MSAWNDQAERARNQLPTTRFPAGSEPFSTPPGGGGIQGLAREPRFRRASVAVITGSGSRRFRCRDRPTSDIVRLTTFILRPPRGREEASVDVPVVRAE